MRGNQYQDRLNDGASSNYEITTKASSQAHSRFIDDVMSAGFLSSTSSRNEIRQQLDIRSGSGRNPQTDMAPQRYQSTNMAGQDYPWYIPDAPYQAQRNDARLNGNAQDVGRDEFARGAYPPGEPAWRRYWRAAQENPRHEIQWGDLPDPYQQNYDVRNARRPYDGYVPQAYNRDGRYGPQPYDRPYGPQPYDQRPYGPQAYGYDRPYPGRNDRYDERGPRNRMDWGDWRDRQDERLTRRDRDRYDRHGRHHHRHDRHDRNELVDRRDRFDRHDRDRYDNLNLPPEGPVPLPRRRDFVDYDRQRDYRIRDERLDRPDRDFSPQNDGSAPSERSEMIARAARRVASEMGSVGWCARGVQRALARAGLPEFVGSGNAWSMLNPMRRSGKFEVVHPSQVREGDIALRQRPGDYGHIAVMLGKDRQGRQLEASDHITVHRPNNPRYSRTVYLRYV